MSIYSSIAIRQNISLDSYMATHYSAKNICTLYIYIHIIFTYKIYIYISYIHCVFIHSYVTQSVWIGFQFSSPTSIDRTKAISSCMLEPEPRFLGFIRKKQGTWCPWLESWWSFAKRELFSFVFFWCSLNFGQTGEFTFCRWSKSYVNSFEKNNSKNTWGMVNSP